MAESPKPTPFNNELYIKKQSEHILERISKFGKLYLEFGGKLFDDHHASRVLPGFKPDTKIKMLLQLKERVEIILCINANDIEKSKRRGDVGITYDSDVLRLIDCFRDNGLLTQSVVITQYAKQPAADSFIQKIQALGLNAYRHYPIQGYPLNVSLIVSEQGFGLHDFIPT